MAPVRPSSFQAVIAQHTPPLSVNCVSPKEGFACDEPGKLGSGSVLEAVMPGGK